jgi:hypothetical protein
MSTENSGSPVSTPIEASLPDAEMLSVREVWLAMGGQAGIHLTKADLLEALADLNRQCESLAGSREDLACYEYLLNCDYWAAKKYLPDLEEAGHKQKLRRKHLHASLTTTF